MNIGNAGVGCQVSGVRGKKRGVKGRVSGVSVGTAALAVLGVLTVAPCALPQASEASLNRYIEDSMRVTEKTVPTPGSLFSGNAYMAELARDPRAALVGDLITILVAEQASALSSGATTQTRSSDSDSSISKFLGVLGGARWRIWRPMTPQRLWTARAARAARPAWPPR
jgi:hypothetical protein